MPPFTDEELGDFLMQAAIDSLGLDEDAALAVAEEMVNAFNGVEGELSQDAVKLANTLRGTAVPFPAEYTEIAGFVQQSLNQIEGLPPPSVPAAPGEPTGESGGPFTGAGGDVESDQAEGKRRLEGVLRGMDLHPDVLKRALATLDADWREFRATGENLPQVAQGAGAALADTFLLWWMNTDKGNERFFESENEWEYDRLVESAEGDERAVLTDLRKEALAAARKRGARLDAMDGAALVDFLGREGRGSTKESVRKFFTAPERQLGAATKDLAVDIEKSEQERRKRLADIDAKAAARELGKKLLGAADLLGELDETLKADYDSYLRSWALPTGLTPEEEAAVGGAAPMSYADWLRTRTGADLQEAARKAGISDLWDRGLLADAFEKNVAVPLRKAAKSPQQLEQAERRIAAMAKTLPFLASRWEAATRDNPTLTPEQFFQTPDAQGTLSSADQLYSEQQTVDAQLLREDFPRVPANLARLPRAGEAPVAQPAALLPRSVGLGWEPKGLGGVFERTPGLREYFQKNSAALGADYSRYLRSQVHEASLGTATAPLSFESWLGQHSGRLESEFLESERVRRTTESPFASVVR